MENLNTIPKWEALYSKVYPTPIIAPDIPTPDVISTVQVTSNNNNLIAGVCIILLVIGGITIYYHIQLQKQKKELSDFQRRTN